MSESKSAWLPPKPPFAIANSVGRFDRRGTREIVVDGADRRQRGLAIAGGILRDRDLRKCLIALGSGRNLLRGCQRRTQIRRSEAAIEREPYRRRKQRGS